MPYVPAENTLMIELRGLYLGEEIENTFYMKRGDTIELAEVTALLNWLETTFISALKPHASADMQWDEIYCTDLTTAVSPTYARVISPNIVGTGSGPGLPGNNACCISFRSNNRGRSSRGRNYFSGLTEANVSGNNVGLTTINSLVAAYELLLGGGTFPAGWDWVIVSRVFEGAFRVNAFVQEVVDVLSTSLTVDSQRGRVR